MPERKSFLLRIDPALYQALEAWAQQELRSVNGQIEYLLKQAVARRRGEDKPGTSAPGPDGTSQDESRAAPPPAP